MMWNPAWESGVEQIDQQHRLLLDQFDSLLVAMHENQASDRIQGILAYLSHYVESHFAIEEAHMRSARYPGLKGHMAMHDSMRAQVVQMVAGYAENPTLAKEAVIDFLTEWLLGHINEVDRPMAQFLLRHGSQSTGTES
jgi:hemerythrin